MLRQLLTGIPKELFHIENCWLCAKEVVGLYTKIGAQKCANKLTN